MRDQLKRNLYFPQTDSSPVEYAVPASLSFSPKASALYNIDRYRKYDVDHNQRDWTGQCTRTPSPGRKMDHVHSPSSILSSQTPNPNLVSWVARIYVTSP